MGNCPLKCTWVRKHLHKHTETHLSSQPYSLDTHTNIKILYLCFLGRISSSWEGDKTHFFLDDARIHCTNTPTSNFFNKKKQIYFKPQVGRHKDKAVMWISERSLDKTVNNRREEGRTDGAGSALCPAEYCLGAIQEDGSYEPNTARFSAFHMRKIYIHHTVLTLISGLGKATPCFYTLSTSNHIT